MPPIGNQREWPRVRESDGTSRSSPTGFYQSANVIERSDRPLAGSLRLGTAPGVGPKGALKPGSSDFGMDRITPRRFDPIGTSDMRTAQPEASDLISKEVRKGSGNRRGG
jgi:hypothetical protein